MNINLKQSFLLGYAYALGYASGRYTGLAQDENDNHDPDNGQFAPKGTDTSSGKEKNPEDISGLWGKEHKGVKGDDAIRLLMKEQNGHVKAAFHRDDIGDIDLIWGNDDIGLKHIIRQRSSESQENLERVLGSLTNTIEKGQLIVNPKGNFEIWHDGNMAVVYPEFKNNNVTFVCTAYRKTRAPRELRASR